jgi:E3 ubiquitin-protein ligase mind-bomb
MVCFLAGGPGSIGDVVGFENVAPDSSRNIVRVQWSSEKSNSYRLGFQGNVDLMCVEEEAGTYYYRDHLPVLSK